MPVPFPFRSPPRREAEKENLINKQNLLNINEKKIRDFRAEIARTRTFVWLPKIDMYVLREFMVPFSILIFAFTLLFMIADLFNDLSDFLDAHSPLVIGARYFLLKVPGNIRFVLPITVLLSCMYTIANFGRHRELTAMRASGISLMRSGLSIYVVAFLVMLANYWFNETLIPQCMKEAELIITLVSKGEAYVNEQSSKLQFHSTDRLRSWFIGQFSENGDQKDVKIKFFKADDTELLDRKKIPIRILQAKSAKFVPEKGWEFNDYVITEYLEGLPSRIKRQPDGGPPLLLPKSEVPENPQMIEKKIVLPETLRTKELYTILKEDKDMAPSLRNVYATLFYYRLAFPLQFSRAAPGVPDRAVGHLHRHRHRGRRRGGLPGPDGDHDAGGQRRTSAALRGGNLSHAGLHAVRMVLPDPEGGLTFGQKRETMAVRGGISYWRR